MVSHWLVCPDDAVGDTERAEFPAGLADQFLPVNQYIGALIFLLCAPCDPRHDDGLAATGREHIKGAPLASFERRGNVGDTLKLVVAQLHYPRRSRASIQSRRATDSSSRAVFSLMSNPLVQ